jgi:hypothetical protein
LAMEAAPKADLPKQHTGSQRSHVPRRDFFSRKWGENATIFHLYRKRRIVICPVRFVLRRRLPTILFGMASKLSNSTFYGDRAPLCAWCAGQTASAEAAALLRYLERIWITVAEVADIVEKNKSHEPLGGDPLHLSPE